MMDRETDMTSIIQDFFTHCKEYLKNLTQFPDCLHNVIIELLIEYASIINAMEVWQAYIDENMKLLQILKH
jgi:vacuolar-type H+-ATPase subunit E/Vma4